MRQHYWEFRSLGVEFVAASNETPESNAELRERLDLPFTLLSDSDADVAKAYGALHENEPRGRSIARPATFLIDASDNNSNMLWEYVGPTSRHRVMPSRMVEEVLNAKDQQHQLVSVIVPDAATLERNIAALQEPRLGLYRTPEDLQDGSTVQREFSTQLAMAAHFEVQRLSAAGWRVAAVTPEFDGQLGIGQRYVFERTLAQ